MRLNHTRNASLNAVNLKMKRKYLHIVSNPHNLLANSKINAQVNPDPYTRPSIIYKNTHSQRNCHNYQDQFQKQNLPENSHLKWVQHVEKQQVKKDQVEKDQVEKQQMSLQMLHTHARSASSSQLLTPKQLEQTVYCKPYQNPLIYHSFDHDVLTSNSLNVNHNTQKLQQNQNGRQTVIIQQKLVPIYFTSSNLPLQQSSHIGHKILHIIPHESMSFVQNVNRQDKRCQSLELRPHSVNESKKGNLFGKRIEFKKPSPSYRPTSTSIRMIQPTQQPQYKQYMQDNILNVDINQEQLIHAKHQQHRIHEAVPLQVSYPDNQLNSWQPPTDYLINPTNSTSNNINTQGNPLGEARSEVLNRIASRYTPVNSFKSSPLSIRANTIIKSSEKQNSFRDSINQTPSKEQQINLIHHFSHVLPPNQPIQHPSVLQKLTIHLDTNKQSQLVKNMKNHISSFSQQPIQLPTKNIINSSGQAPYFAPSLEPVKSCQFLIDPQKRVHKEQPLLIKSESSNITESNQALLQQNNNIKQFASIHCEDQPIKMIMTPQRSKNLTSNYTSRIKMINYPTNPLNKAVRLNQDNQTHSNIIIIHPQYCSIKSSIEKQRELMESRISEKLSQLQQKAKSMVKLYSSSEPRANKQTILNRNKQSFDAPNQNAAVIGVNLSSKSSNKSQENVHSHHNEHIASKPNFNMQLFKNPHIDNRDKALQNNNNLYHQNSNKSEGLSLNKSVYKGALIVNEVNKENVIRVQKHSKETSVNSSSIKNQILSKIFS